MCFRFYDTITIDEVILFMPGTVASCIGTWIDQNSLANSYTIGNMGGDFGWEGCAINIGGAEFLYFHTLGADNNKENHGWKDGI